MTATKKPRARQFGNKWVIHTGNFKDPHAIGHTLEQAWFYWQNLIKIKGDYDKVNQSKNG